MGIVLGPTVPGDEMEGALFEVVAPEERVPFVPFVALDCGSGVLNVSKIRTKAISKTNDMETFFQKIICL